MRTIIVYNLLNDNHSHLSQLKATINTMNTTLKSLSLFALSAAAFAVQAQANTLNLYSARHYDTDEALYQDFTKATGIKINRIEVGDDALISRLASEGNKSPADVVLMVDASRMIKGQIEGLFAPVNSAVLNSAIPAQFRAADNSWFGLTTRARTVVFNKVKVKANEVDAYEKLADPVNAGKLCTRSGSHPYNLSLFGAMVERLGVPKTESLLKGYVSNMARSPVGGDYDQIKAVGSGECGVALVNTYYWLRAVRSNKPEDIAMVAKIGMVWPNQSAPYASGVHLNIAGAAMTKYAPNKAAAVAFIEYLASPSVQGKFADGNNEWPLNPAAKINNPALTSMGTFKAETVPASAFALRQVTAQRLLNQVGYK